MLTSSYGEGRGVFFLRREKERGALLFLNREERHSFLPKALGEVLSSCLSRAERCSPLLEERKKEGQALLKETREALCSSYGEDRNLPLPKEHGEVLLPS